MARVKSHLVRKLKKALIDRFPPPATVRLEEHNGVFGVVTSTDFARMDSLDRQDLMSQILQKNLDPDERRQVQIIVAVTPDEGDGYLAGEPVRRNGVRH